MNVRLFLAAAAALAFLAPDAGAVATQIAAGTGHACALDGGAVVCWGSNAHGQTTVPGTVNGAGEATTIAASNDTSCAIDSSGAVRCWGLNTNGQATPPASVDGSTGNDASAIAVGEAASCAIRTATSGVTCWGDAGIASAVPASVNGTSGTASAIAVGDERACAVRVETGLVVCWGPRERGAGPASEVREGLGTNTVSALSMAGGFALALTTAGDSVFWGGFIPSYWVPWQPISGGPAVKWSALAVGPRSGCAVRAAPGDATNPTGGVRCSGGKGPNPIPPASVDGTTGDAIALAVGLDFACAIRASSAGLVCWGANGAGQATPPGGL